MIGTAEAVRLLGWFEDRHVTSRHMRRIAKEHHVVACMANSRTARWRIEDIERLAAVRADVDRIA